MDLYLKYMINCEVYPLMCYNPKIIFQIGEHFFWAIVFGENSVFDPKECEPVYNSHPMYLEDFTFDLEAI